jgi:hypothetical protein
MLGSIVVEALGVFRVAGESCTDKGEAFLWRGFVVPHVRLTQSF